TQRERRRYAVRHLLADCRTRVETRNWIWPHRPLQHAANIDRREQYLRVPISDNYGYQIACAAQLLPAARYPTSTHPFLTAGPIPVLLSLSGYRPRRWPALRSTVLPARRPVEKLVGRLQPPMLQRVARVA